MNKYSAHQIWVFPHTRLIAVFHPATATGKLNAVMIPTKPNGFHFSNKAWFGPKKKEERFKRNLQT